MSSCFANRTPITLIWMTNLEMKSLKTNILMTKTSWEKLYSYTASTKHAQIDLNVQMLPLCKRHQLILHMCGKHFQHANRGLIIVIIWWNVLKVMCKHALKCLAYIAQGYTESLAPQMIWANVSSHADMLAKNIENFDKLAKPPLIIHCIRAYMN